MSDTTLLYYYFRAMQGKPLRDKRVVEVNLNKIEREFLHTLYKATYTSVWLRSFQDDTFEIVLKNRYSPGLTLTGDRALKIMSALWDIRRVNIN